MKITNNKDQLVNTFVHLHDDNWLQKQRVAGQCVADVMQLLTDLIQSGKERNLLVLNEIGKKEIESRKCSCTFLGYKNFPGALCISVNKQLVHGIPRDYNLKDGDLVTLDFGATFEGAIADSAKTIEVGATKLHPMIKAANDCLYNAIRSIAVGKRTGVIGYTIYRTAKHAGFNVIDRYGGHGIDWNKPHADLFISNRSSVDEGVVIQPGLTIAIEPLLVPGNCSTQTKIDADGWTIMTEGLSAHTEHSIYVHSDHVEIITYRSDEGNDITRIVEFGAY